LPAPSDTDLSITLIIPKLQPPMWRRRALIVVRSASPPQCLFVRIRETDLATRGMSALIKLTLQNATMMDASVRTSVNANRHQSRAVRE
jgi:hypothetical protein